MKKKYYAEAALVSVLITFFKILPTNMASACGGKILRSIGPLLSSNRRAKRHIMNSLQVTEAEAEIMSRDMWDNLGRVFAEYPHLHEIYDSHVELCGKENLIGLDREGVPAIFFSGHLANWEVAAPSLRQKNIDVDLIYRAPNNPFVDKILQKCRSMNGVLRTYPKSSAGMRQVLSALKEGRKIGILIDQKYNQGIEFPFFGQPAMTSPAFIQLAKKFNCPLLPVQVERIEHRAAFRVTVHAPLDLQKSEDELLSEAHALLEGWIRQHPAHWLWPHKRWKRS